MQARDWEFRYRFWIFGGIFWLAFAAYFVDGKPSGVRVAHWLSDVLPGHPPWERVFQGLAVLSAGFVLATAWLRTWATAYLRSDVVHDQALHSEGLVADGPFRHVRNPLYLGNYLLICGVAFVASVPGCLWLLIGIPLFTLRLIRREEHELLQSQGEAYRQYLSRVPRLLPALVPRVAASGRHAQYGQAVRGELWVWSFAAAAAAFAWTLDRAQYGWVMMIGMALYVVLNWRGAGRRSAASADSR